MSCITAWDPTDRKLAHGKIAGSGSNGYASAATVFSGWQSGNDALLR
jgi:hypothetical protein